MNDNKKALKNLKKIEKNIPNSIYFTTHKNWNSIFSQQTRLTKKNLDYFLDQKTSLSFGIGISKNDQKAELESFKFLYNIITTSNSKIINYLKTIKCEEVFGENPISFKGFHLTRSNLMNAESVFYLMELIPQLNEKKDIKILEIGSGYGEFCRQILKYSSLKVGGYHLVDLPKNLLFAEKYLSKVFSRSMNLKTRITDNDSRNNYGIDIKFFLPHEVPKLKKYDLIINTYSLQEMEPRTASAYFKFIEKNLEDDGYFYSINSPKKWSITSYADYNNLDNLFNMCSLMHRQIPPSIYGTVPIVNVFKKNNIKYSILDLEFLSNLQDKGFTNLLNSIFDEFSLSNFTKTFFDEEFKHFDLKKIESEDFKNLTDKQLFYYFVAILIYDSHFDYVYGDLLINELLNNKNKSVSLKLLFEFSKIMNQQLSINQINNFIYSD